MGNSHRSYEHFFGLNQEPFSIAPDPRFLYMSDKHSEALDLLSYGLARGASFVLLTGEIGAGKTTVWRRFLELLPSNFDVANVVNPKLDVNQLLARVCDDLHVELPRGEGTIDLIDALHGHLLLASAQGRRTLIVIDEAQALSGEVLEQLRLLTNLDATGEKLQVMLIGQPELLDMLERPALKPLAQRIVARYHLLTLSSAETAGYVAHRLTVAGLRGPMPFDAESIGLIHRLCHGVPRRINAVCDRALATAQASGSRRVDRDIAKRAAADVFGRRAGAPEQFAATASPPSKIWAVTAAVGMGLISVAWFAPRWADSGMATASPPAAIAATTLAAPAAPTPTEQVLATAAAAAAPTALAAPAVNASPSAERSVLGAATNELRTLSINDAFVASTADEGRAWRALAGLWNTSLGAGEPCGAAARLSLHCYRGNGGLTMIRQLDRPGVLRLVDERGRVAHVLLVGLTADAATLELGGVELTLPLMQLARVWRGEYATYWRQPAANRPGDAAPTDTSLNAWVLQRLPDIDGLETKTGDEDALRSRIASFQTAQGLKPDGIAGPLTLMQISRASGVDEPRLSRRTNR